MTTSTHSRLARITGVLFAVLVIAANVMQGSVPAMHDDAQSVVDFYADKSTLVAVAMSLSLVSLLFLAAFLAALPRALEPVETSLPTRAVLLGGAALVALLAGGFALNSAGALRAGATEGIAPESAVVFFDGGLALTGIAAPLAMAVVLAATAWVVLSTPGRANWFGYLTAVLAVLGIVTPLAFVLSLLFPLWVLIASFVLFDGDARAH